SAARGSLARGRAPRIACHPGRCVLGLEIVRGGTCASKLPAAPCPSLQGGRDVELLAHLSRNRRLRLLLSARDPPRAWGGAPGCRGPLNSGPPWVPGGAAGPGPPAPPPQPAARGLSTHRLLAGRRRRCRRRDAPGRSCPQPRFAPAGPVCFTARRWGRP